MPVRKGALLFETAVALLIGTLVVVASVALLGQVLGAVRQVRLPALEACESALWRLCSATPPAGVEVGASGVAFRYLSAYRGGEVRQASLSLSGSELVLSEGGSSRVAARGIKEASFSVSGGLLRASLRGEGWSWERDFALLGGG